MTTNKRECVYVDNVFVGTRPYKYEDILKRIEPSPQHPLLITAPTQLLIEAPSPTPDVETKAFILIDNIIEDTICLPAPSPQEGISLEKSKECRSLINYSKNNNKFIKFEQMKGYKIKGEVVYRIWVGNICFVPHLNGVNKSELIPFSILRTLTNQYSKHKANT